MHWSSSAGFAAHGASFLWMPSLLWTYAVSDALIGLSYCSIPFGIAYFMHRRAAFEFNWMYALAAAFLFSCGMDNVASRLLCGSRGQGGDRRHFCSGGADLVPIDSENPEPAARRPVARSGAAA